MALEMAENYCTIGFFVFAADMEQFMVKRAIKLDRSELKHDPSKLAHRLLAD
jgi:hypothetical protein